LESPEINY